MVTPNGRHFGIIGEKMSIGSRLKKIRQNNNQSQEQTATIFNITKQTLSRYEKGQRTPDNDFLKHFGMHFKINANWLLYNEPPIFKEGVAQKDVKSLFLELVTLMTRSENQELSDLEFVDIPTDRLSNVPENFLLMLGYMLKYEKVRRNVLRFFYLFEKPDADNNLSDGKETPTGQ